MFFDPTVVARYTAEDVRQTHTFHDGEAFVGYVADRREGSPMGLAFVHFEAGVNFDFSWPYDELSVVTEGRLTVRTAEGVISAGPGQILNQPRGVPGTFEIEERLRMVCVHHPTFQEAVGVSVEEFGALSERDEEPDMSASPRGPEHSGGFFDPTIMQVFDSDDLTDWVTVDEGSRAYVGYVADREQGSPMGIAFSRFGRGGVFDLVFPYDEAAVITKGRVTVESAGSSFTVLPGELLYMPANTSAVFRLEEDTEAVGVHHPTFEEAFGHPPHRS